MGCTGAPEPAPCEDGAPAYPRGWADAVAYSPHEWAPRMVRGDVEPIRHCLRLDHTSPDVHGALMWYALVERGLGGSATDLHPYHAAVCATIQAEITRGQTSQYEDHK